MSSYDFGDEVWVRATVAANVYEGVMPPLTVNGYKHKITAVPEDIRTAEDFTNPLDQGVVKAAIHFHHHDDTSSVIELNEAVQAKLDAEAAEKVSVSKYALKILEKRSTPGCAADALSDLLAAGLLREESS